MAAPQSLPQNDSLLNRAAWRQLKEAKQSPDPYTLHLLTLALWGLDQEAAGDWPQDHRDALEQGVGLLLGWEPQNVLDWLLSNPNGEESPEDQEAMLVQSLQQASSPMQAANLLLNAIYSRQVSQNSQLQPAASELT